MRAKPSSALPSARAVHAAAARRWISICSAQYASFIVSFNAASLSTSPRARAASPLRAAPMARAK